MSLINILDVISPLEQSLDIVELFVVIGIFIIPIVIIIIIIATIKKTKSEAKKDNKQ